MTLAFIEGFDLPELLKAIAFSEIPRNSASGLIERRSTLFWRSNMPNPPGASGESDGETTGSGVVSEVMD
jgi:hypothetical protein